MELSNKNKKILELLRTWQSEFHLYEFQRFHSMEILDILDEEEVYEFEDYLDSDDNLESELGAFAVDGAGGYYAIWKYPNLKGEAPIVLLDSEGGVEYLAGSLNDFICRMIQEMSFCGGWSEDDYNYLVDDYEEEYSKTISIEKVKELLEDERNIFKKQALEIIDYHDSKEVYINLKKHSKRINLVYLYHLSYYIDFFDIEDIKYDLIKPYSVIEKKAIVSRIKEKHQKHYNTGAFLQFRKNIPDVWERPIYLPYLQSELTPDILEDAEKILGYKLPQLYVDLLRIQNGGYINKLFKGNMLDTLYGIGSYSPSLTDIKFSIDGLIIFSTDEDGYICLDYRYNETNPQVSYINIEMDEQKVLTETFEEFISELYTDLENKFGIRDWSSLSTIAKDIEKNLDIKPSITQELGHIDEIYTFKLGTNSFCWLTGNRVLKGAISKKDKKKDPQRYKKFEYLEKNTTYKIEEVGLSGFILTFSEPSPDIVKRLLENGIDIEALHGDTNV